MPFGLCHVLATFLKLVIKTLKKYLNEFIQIFLDDFCVCGDKRNHMNQLKKCLKEC